MVDAPVMAAGTTSPDHRERIRIDIGLLVLRLGIATAMFALHGWARLIRAFNYSVFGADWPFVDLVAGLGFPAAGLFAVASALSESIGALLVGIGLFTRLAAGTLVMDMIVALYNEIAGGDPIELPALYLIASVAVVIAGPGGYSADALWKRGAPSS
jgi:putative oxidoreductase